MTSSPRSPREDVTGPARASGCLAHRTTGSGGRGQGLDPRSRSPARTRHDPSDPRRPERRAEAPREAVTRLVIGSEQLPVEAGSSAGEALAPGAPDHGRLAAAVAGADDRRRMRRSRLHAQEHSGAAPVRLDEHECAVVVSGSGSVLLVPAGDEVPAVGARRSSAGLPSRALAAPLPSLLLPLRVTPHRQRRDAATPHQHRTHERRPREPRDLSRPTDPTRRTTSTPRARDVSAADVRAVVDGAQRRSERVLIVGE